MHKNILIIIGTRPEAIKMAPVISELQQQTKLFRVATCITGQHKEMLSQVMDFFDIKHDYDLALMKPNQSLFDITSTALKGLEKVIDESNPDFILVQGDTTTAFSGALAGFYKKKMVVHIEAGLRSHDIYLPYPEEVNRILISKLSTIHFTPTAKAAKNLALEGINKNVFIVGNTVIDALIQGLKIIEQKKKNEIKDYFNFLDFSKKIILVTAHRRESFGEPLKNICTALKKIVSENKEVIVVFPVHLNPSVQEVVNKNLSNQPRIHLTSPLSYPHLIWIMSKSNIIITDSGGIQEEGPSLRKPVLVIRNITERQEGIKSGNAKLVGTNTEKIVDQCNLLLNSHKEYNKMTAKANPYGDGTASQKIVAILKTFSKKTDK